MTWLFTSGLRRKRSGQVCGLRSTDVNLAIIPNGHPDVNHSGFKYQGMGYCCPDSLIREVVFIEPAFEVRLHL